MKIYTINSILCILTVGIITSCSNKKQNIDKVKTLKSVVENTLNKKLDIPNSLEVYSPFSKSLVNKNDILNSKYKIFSRIDASCGTCIQSINSWNELIPEFSQYKVPVILICSSDDNFELIKYFCETREIIDFGYPFFLDKKDEFVKMDLQGKTGQLDRANASGFF